MKNLSQQGRILRGLLHERILILDLDMGTMIQQRNPSAADFGGPALDGCNEHLVVSKPEIILDIHRKYLEAGADIIETDTFGGTSIVLAEYQLQEQAYAINRIAAELARRAADEFSTPTEPRFVAGAMGPTTKAITVTGGVTFAQLQQAYFEQARALIDGGVDLLLLETCQDTRNIKAGALAVQLERFIHHAWLNLVGGCCGTTEQHIRAIAEMAQGKRPRHPPEDSRRAVYSGIEMVEAEESTRPLLVGERTNVIGSRLFKELVSAEQWEEATEIARRQVKNGAHIVDVCLQTTEREELGDIPPFYEKLIRKIKVPIMIDTTDARAVELALAYCQGKSIINSINLEDGEEKFQKVSPLARAYGAAVIVGCIDEDPAQAQAFTRERKLAIAQRSYQLLTEKYGIPPQDIIFDPLVFPCATGDENYIGGAVETIQALRLIKQHIPFARTVLGISNISFGLPPGAREVVNSVFLYYCTKAGLDLAIVNAERLERFASIPETERKLAEDLLFNHVPVGVPPDHPQAALFRDAPADWRAQTREQKVAINQFHITAITAHFRTQKKKEKARAADLPLDQRLANYILEGTKEGLIEDLNHKLQEGPTPLDIINGPLMEGMAEVGRRFNDNELIVAEVLQSAEAMKTAVGYLERFMEKADIEKRAKVILATVKGDVHDIGKNLVEIIFKNNGYDVINLGIKVPPEELIRAFKEHQPHAIGLSGLLVKSAQQMVITAADLREAGISVPLLVGGAALSEKFTRQKIAPSYGQAVCYAKDAMTGLHLMNQLSDPTRRNEVRSEEHTSELQSLAYLVCRLLLEKKKKTKADLQH